MSSCWGCSHENAHGYTCPSVSDRENEQQAQRKARMPERPCQSAHADELLFLLRQSKWLHGETDGLLRLAPPHALSFSNLRSSQHNSQPSPLQPRPSLYRPRIDQQQNQVMSVLSARRVEEDSLSELEVAFLESVEAKRDSIMSAKCASQNTTATASLAQRLHSSLSEWRSRLVSQLDDLKDKFVHSLVCGAHDADTFLDDLDDAYDEQWVLEKPPVLLRKGKIPKSSASVAPFSAAIQRFSDATAAGMAAPSTEGCTSPINIASGLEDISHVLSDAAASVDVERQAAVRIQRMLRSRPASSKVSSILKPHDQVQDESVRVYANFARVCLALKCIFAMKKLANERRNRSAYVIQRTWCRARQFMTIQTPPLVLASKTPVESASPMIQRKRARSCIDDLVLDATEQFDDELSSLIAQESNVAVSELLEEHETHFSVKRCVSVPPPLSSAIRPVAIKSHVLMVRCRAARVIQSAWRCAMAREHMMALRRLSAYEQGCQSVMPEVRSQMTIVRQRLSELRSRGSSSSSGSSGSNGSSDIEFDDDWL